MTKLPRFVAVAMITAVMVFAPTAAAKPAFDCTDPAVRRAYPAQCPELGVPFLLGGGSPSEHPPAGCGGLCGLVDGVLKRIGLGGIL